MPTSPQDEDEEARLLNEAIAESLKEKDRMDREEEANAKGPVASVVRDLGGKKERKERAAEMKAKKEREKEEAWSE